MLVRMRTTMAGPMGAYHAGAIVAFTDGLAEALIAGGYAEAAEEAATPALNVPGAPETTAVQPGSEAAVPPKARRRRA